MSLANQINTGTQRVGGSLRGGCLADAGGRAQVRHVEQREEVGAQFVGQRCPRATARRRCPFLHLDVFVVDNIAFSPVRPVR
jgi:hypothetical protein